MRQVETTCEQYAAAPASFRLCPGKSILRHLCGLVEKTDWDEELMAQEIWIRRVCCGVVLLAALYFAPICLSVFLG